MKRDRWVNPLAWHKRHICALVIQRERERFPRPTETSFAARLMMTTIYSPLQGLATDNFFERLRRWLRSGRWQTEKRRGNNPVACRIIRCSIAPCGCRILPDLRRAFSEAGIGRLPHSEDWHAA